MSNTQQTQTDAARAKAEAEHAWKMAALANTWAARTGLGSTSARRPIPTVGESETGFWGYRPTRD